MKVLGSIDSKAGNTSKRIKLLDYEKMVKREDLEAFISKEFPKASVVYSSLP